MHCATCFFAIAGYIILCFFRKVFLKFGEMAERSKAAVSKTVNGFFPFGGSNPPLSAIFTLKNGHSSPFLPHFSRFFLEKKPPELYIVP